MPATLPSPWLAPFLAVVAGYLLGALPFGYLVARAHGIDIFQHGSRSPGATNVRRVLGKRAGNTVFVLDALKGAVAAGWTLLLPASLLPHRILPGLLGLVAALVGHSFSCFTRFRGGKGVATSAGGLLVLLPIETLACAVVWIAVFYLSGYVSLASILAASALPLAAWLLRAPAGLVIVAGVVAVFVVARHRANIARLLSGTENRFKRS